ncbi:MAG: hypothetical protein ACODAF_04500 [Actinomycetota bacterium]
MESRDDDYEVLDPGEYPRDRQADGVLPILDLGDRTDGPADGVGDHAGRVPMPTWQRWAALAVALVVGAVAGAYVWYARDESARVAAEADRVVLVASQVTGAFSYDQFGLIRAPNRLAVELHNPGPRDVRVSDVRLREWRFQQDSGPRRVRTVPQGGWTRFALVGDLACVGSVPRQLEVDVRTDAGRASIVVPLPPVGRDHDDRSLLQTLDSIYSSVCGDTGSGRIMARTINTRRAAVDPQVLQMGVQLLVPGPEAEITAIHGSAAGYRGVGTDPDLPIPSGGDRRSITVAVDWRVVNCSLTAELGGASLDVEISEAGESAAVNVMLPPEAVAALARFGAEECGL